MKKKLLLCVLVVLMLGSVSTAFAQQNSALNDWDCYFNPGNLTVSAGVGFGGFWYGGFGLNLYPGLEFTFAKPKFGGVVPISFGVAARGLFGIYPGYIGGVGFQAGVAGLGTVHLSLKGIDFNSDFLNMLDFYVGFGVSVLFLSGYYVYYSPVPVAFASFQGVNYFFSDSFALYVESSYLGRYDYWLTVGALFKLGK
jgi:hypothetical protein